MKIYEIVGVDEERDEIEVWGDWGSGFETRLFSFDDFDMDYDRIVATQEVIFHANKFYL